MTFVALTGYASVYDWEGIHNNEYTKNHLPQKENVFVTAEINAALGHPFGGQRLPIFARHQGDPNCLTPRLANFLAMGAKYIESLEHCPEHLQHIMSGVYRLFTDYQSVPIFRAQGSYPVCTLLLLQIAARPQDHFTHFLQTPDLFEFTKLVCQQCDTISKKRIICMNIGSIFSQKIASNFFAQGQSDWNIHAFSTKVWQAMASLHNPHCTLCDAHKDTPPLPAPDQPQQLWKHMWKTVEHAHKQPNRTKTHEVAKEIFAILSQYAKKNHIHTIDMHLFLNLFTIEALVHYTEESDIAPALFNPDALISDKALEWMYVMQRALRNPDFITCMETHKIHTFLGHKLLVAQASSQTFCPSLALLDCFYHKNTLLGMYHAFSNFTSYRKDKPFLNTMPLLECTVQTVAPSTILSQLASTFEHAYKAEIALVAFAQDLTTLSDKSYFSHVFVALMEWKRIIQHGAEADKGFLKALLAKNPYYNPAKIVYTLISYAINHDTAQYTFATQYFQNIFGSCIYGKNKSTVFPFLCFLHTMHSEENFLTPLERDLKSAFSARLLTPRRVPQSVYDPLAHRVRDHLP